MCLNFCFIFCPKITINLAQLHRLMIEVRKTRVEVRDGKFSCSGHLIDRHFVAE